MQQHHQRHASNPHMVAPPPSQCNPLHQHQQQQPPLGATNGDIARVYIGGLDRRATHADLAVFCQQVGQVRGCRVAYDHATNASKCYGYADYATPLDALRAVAYLNGALLFQRPCRVTPVLRDTTSRKGAVREAVAGLAESPTQLAALPRAARDEKMRTAVAWRIAAHHRDQADSLSRAFVAALGHEPASLVALLAYPTLLEAWVWEALGVSGPHATPPSSAHPPVTTGAGNAARGKGAAVAPPAGAARACVTAATTTTATTATEAQLTPPLAPAANDDVEALELRLDALVRTFSEDDGGSSNTRDGSSSGGGTSGQRNSSSPDSCGRGGSPDAPSAADAPTTEAALRGALQQYPFLVRVAGQGRPQLPLPPMWRGGPPTASAASAALSLSGQHTFATPVMSPATMSPYVSATTTPSGPAATVIAAATPTAMSTGSGPMLPIGGTTHVSPLLFGAIPPHAHHHHHNHHHHHHHYPHQPHQQQHGAVSHGGPLMPPSPINLTGFAHAQLQQQQQQQQQQPGSRGGSGSPTQLQQQQQMYHQHHQYQQRPFVVAGGPQFPPATPHDVAAIFGAPLRGLPAAHGPSERALVPGPSWSPTSAQTAATVAAMAAFASAAAFEASSPTVVGALSPAPGPLTVAAAGLGYFPAGVPPAPMVANGSGGIIAAGPFNVLLGQGALHGDPTRSLPTMPYHATAVSVPGLTPNAVPPSFPPPGLHRQQRLARQQQQQQQRQIAALVAAATGNVGNGCAAVNGAVGAPLPGSGLAVPQGRRGDVGSGAALSTGALLPDLANSSPQESYTTAHTTEGAALRRLCATSTDSGAALDLLLLQAAASETSGSASSTAVNTLSSCGSAGGAAASLAQGSTASLHW